MSDYTVDECICDSHTLVIFRAGKGDSGPPQHEGFRAVLGIDGKPLAPGYYFAVVEGYSDRPYWGGYVSAPKGPYPLRMQAVKAMIAEMSEHTE